MAVDAAVPEPVDYVFLANESFPDLARLSWPGLNAVIGGLKPGDLTLTCFSACLPSCLANRLGFSAPRAPSPRKHDTIAP
jgi:hypothetical protein